ncbi:hypothetical protein PISL3812_07886 [Talaromyces islandicus]|uniref:Glutamine repeat protein-1 n=1 Tax=Talaromyces islandicus TaxID=28573 RepID=A0A0U1M793_TALIS|nr:hypothetical protein PISL3812_07886 [Talaromyces islandicus]
MNPNPAYAAMQQHHQQQQQHQQHQNPMLAAAAAGYPMHTGSPANQQFPFYANNPNNNPMAAGYPQMRPGAVQQPLHSFNGMPTQTSGGMMPANMSAPHANLPYSSPSPYPPTSIANSTPSPSHTQSPSTLPTTSVQPSTQNMAAFSNPAMMAAAQRRPSPTVQTEGQQQAQQTQQSAPQSPATASRERDRIGALLNINSALFREVVNLQAAGKAGAPAQPPGQDQQQAGSPAPKPAPNDPSKKPSQEYVDCMRRLQANLAYLATIADRSKKPGNAVPPGPQILTPPPNVPGMEELYARLNELFPEAHRNPTTPAQQKPSQPGLAAENAV